MSILERLRERLSIKTFIRGEEERREAYGPYLIITTDKVEVYTEKGAEFPYRTFRYYPDTGCFISPSALRITKSMIMKYGELYMDATPNKYHVIAFEGQVTIE